MKRTDLFYAGNRRIHEYDEMNKFDLIRAINGQKLVSNRYNEYPRVSKMQV